MFRLILDKILFDSLRISSNIIYIYIYSNIFIDCIGLGFTFFNKVCFRILGQKVGGFSLKHISQNKYAMSKQHFELDELKLKVKNYSAETISKQILK